jgi:hypothetical protein
MDAGFHQENEATMRVRQATLDDTQAVSALFRSQIAAWQRINARGQVEDVPYDSLTVYERWLHGGPWMSVETGALQLSHLLRGAGIPLVGEDDGQVLAYAEAYHGVEPEPFGDHLHLSAITLADGADGMADALVDYALEQASAARCKSMTATVVANDEAARTLYTLHGLQAVSRAQRVSLPARTGQGFYKVAEQPSANPEQISGWSMPIGRFSSARQQWETLWPRTWNAIAEIRSRRIHRLRFSASGQEALLCCQQQLYAPRNADIALWSPKPLTAQLLTALRDWSHKEGYRTLVLLVPDESVKTLGPEAEPDGYFQETYAVGV